MFDEVITDTLFQIAREVEAVARAGQGLITNFQLASTS
jgi:hypothetical protein